MRVLYYDCFSGISGDMNLGALLDLGVDAKHLKEELSKLSLDQHFSLEICESSKMGICGTRVSVKLVSQEHSHGGMWHAHPHSCHHHGHDHTHRTYADIEALILASTLSEAVKEQSLKMFWLVAVAEGKIHGKKPHEVGFHEVGAIDSIVDIVGAAICLEALHVKKIIASKIELGGGFVTCAHGTFPVPAPATIEILNDVPVSLGRVDSEATTPTGAAIIKANVNVFEEQPSFKINKIGYGIGHKDFKIPNVLRVFLGEMNETIRCDKEIVLETNVDDMNPEILAYVQERLFAIGVKDVYTTAITTKKNRLGVKLCVLVSLEKEDDAKRLIFEETSSIGLRRYVVDKIALERMIKVVETPYGAIEVKCSFHEGKMLKYKAEFETCKHAALLHNVPIARVYESVAREMNESCYVCKI
ncbi:MAG: nickel pincer cofactor biosynthesis protein LarC [Sulfurospirillum sp.]|nr:nickel pincer cofactor biosynthesis protein LarC [Sulfurospirillum sp.]